jgi:putative DNA primase/helicase
MIEHKDDTRRLKQALAYRAEEIACHLFGKPSSRTRVELRFGGHGSTAVTVAGSKAGRFHSFEAGVGGSMIDAIMFAHDCNLSRAFEIAREYVGEEWVPPPKPILVDVDEVVSGKQREALDIWHASRLIDGTPAETYLRGRGIDAKCWPASLRWNSRIGALVVAAQDAAGDVVGIQRILLRADGTAKRDAEGNKLKRSLGAVGRGAVRYPGSDAAVLLAEGPETGLSAWYATGIETRVLLGSMAKADLSDIDKRRPIVVMADDDARNAPSRKALNDAIRRWRRDGRTVLKVRPWDRARHDKSDINDMLQERGAVAVRDRISRALAQDTPHALLSRDAASRELHVAFLKAEQTLLAAWGEERPPVVGINVTGGGGKTEEALHLVSRWHGPVVIAVPTHALSGELERRARTLAKDRKISVWRGRQADDPASKEHKMCLDLEAVQAVQDAGGDPQTQACEGKDAAGNVVRCAFFEQCSYQRQRAVTGADVWIVAHDLLFSDKPANIPAPTLLVIDESFIAAGLRGSTSSKGDEILLSMDDISAPIFARGRELDADLADKRQALWSVLGEHPEGPLEQDRLALTLFADTCEHGAKQERASFVEPNIWPGMPPALRDAEARRCAGNKMMRRMARLWKLIGAQIEAGIERSGNVEIVKRETTDGHGYRAVRLSWREDIKEGWRAPTLHIDATLRPELVQAYFPQFEVLADIKIDAPHQETIQIAERTFSTSALCPRNSDDEKTLARKQAGIDRLWWWSLAKARSFGGAWLLIVNKAVEEDIRARHTVPAFIDITHHNATRGRDEWKNVRGVIDVGRTLPPPRAVERMAGALTGRWVEPVDWYDSTDAKIVAGNDSMIVERDVHPDAVAEQVRGMTCDDGLRQNEWRARGVNRSAATPLTIFRLGTIALGEVDRFEAYELLDRTFAETGVYLENASHAERLVPGIRLRRHRHEVVAPDGPHLTRVQYKLAGQGSREAVAMFDPRSVPDPEAWLQEHLGALAEIDVREPAQAEIVAVEAFSGGRLSEAEAAWLDARIAASGMKRGEIAKLAGMSFPTLSSGISRRFGLSPDLRERLFAVVRDLPERQRALL